MDGVARSIGLLGNAAEVLPELVARGFTPDVVTDQTSAHDPLVGYVPNGLSLADAARAARGRSRPSTSADRIAAMGAHVAAMREMQRARRDRVRLRQQHSRPGREGRRHRRVRDSRASCPSTSGRSSAKARARSAGSRSRAIRKTFASPIAPRSRCSRRRAAVPLDSRWPASACSSRDCRRASAGSATAIAREFGLRLNELVRDGAVKAPIVIGRDHLDTGSVASPNRETEGMRDGSDAIADWPILNALLNASAGATWVSVHHGGGVGIGYSIHAGMVIVADGTREADERLRARADVRSRHRRGAARRRRLSRSAQHRASTRSTHSHAGDEPMMAPHAGLERRVLAALEATPARIPVVHRRLRQRPHHAAARAGRPAGPRPVPVHRRRARGEHAGALPPRGGGGVAVHDQRPERRGAGAGASAREAFDRTLALLSRARAADDAPGDVPARRSARAADVRKLPRPAPRAARDAARAGGERQPLRADQPLRGARASAAARRPRPLRGDPPAAADRRPRSPRCCRRWATPRRRIASSSAAPSRRWPTAAPPTCARSAKPPAR